MLCVIQARMGSKRLRGKMLLKIDKKTILEHVTEKVKKIDFIKKIIVATTNDKDDDLIEKLCKKNNLSIFRGSKNNVFDRFQKISIQNKYPIIMRINGDSPLLDINLFNKMIKFSKNKKYDIFTNVQPRTFPQGQSLELIKRSVLFNIDQTKLTKKHKEHVTSYFYENKKEYKIINYTNNINLGKINLSINTNKDYIKTRNLFKKYQNKTYDLDYLTMANFFKY
jgi:spore coat polysaccharide biosynthesis protein SpsF